MLGLPALPIVAATSVCADAKDVLAAAAPIAAALAARNRPRLMLVFERTLSLPSRKYRANSVHRCSERPLSHDEEAFGALIREAIER